MVWCEMNDVLIFIVQQTSNIGQFASNNDESKKFGWPFQPFIIFFYFLLPYLLHWFVLQQLPYSPLGHKYDYCRKIIPLLNVLVLLGNVLEGIFFNLCRRKTFGFYKGNYSVQSILSLTKCVCTRMWEEEGEKRRGREGWANN